MTADGLFWVVVGGVLGTSFAAIGARALRNFSRHELEEVCRRGKATDMFGEILRTHERVGRGVENLVVVATSLLIVAGTYWMFLSWGEGTAPPRVGAFALEALVWAVVLSAAKLWIPWSIERLWAEEFLYHTWRIWQFSARLMQPLLWLAHLIDVIIHRIAGRVPETPNGDTFEEEIRSIVTEGHREGLLEEEAREMIEGVIELGDAVVSEIMTPRTDMHMVSLRMQWDEMLKYLIEVGHSRIPVYDTNRDDIVGVLYSKDLLPEMASSGAQEHRPLKQIMRLPHFVPETKAVDDLLEEFRQTRNHLFIVLDEYGGVSGLVTIEDVLEEIVGEIVDEYDPELVEEIEVIDEGCCEALGRAHIDEINEAMNLDLPDEGDYDTIAGFVFSELGRVPEPQETLSWNDRIRITVLEATARRIQRVRIQRLEEVSRESA